MGDAEIINKLREKLKQIENEPEDYADYMGRIGGLWHQIRVYSTTNWNIQSEETLKEMGGIRQTLENLFASQIEPFITDVFNHLESQIEDSSDPEKQEMFIEVYENRDAFKAIFRMIVFNSSAFTHIYTSVNQIEEKTDYTRQFINNCFDCLIEIGFGGKAKGRTRSKHIKIGGKQYSEIPTE